MLRCSRLTLAASLLLAAAVPARGDGLLGLFFDRDGVRCAGDVPTAATVTMYVVLVADGATYGGSTGVEFRIDAAAASGFLLQNERPEPGVTTQIGQALGAGTNVAFAACQSRGVVPILSFQVINAGSSARDADLRVVTRTTPTSPAFPCPLAVLCDAPTYSKVCVEGGKAVLNPTGTRSCGSSREESEWSRVKALYR